MTATVLAPAEVPLKCAGHGGPDIPANPCRKPGSLPRCGICPKSPIYWRRTEVRAAA